MSLIRAAHRSGTFGSTPRARGFTLVEVLIAMIVIAIGILGVASMQLMSFQNNQGAYLRSQATVLAMDFLDRIRSNRGGWQNGAYDNFAIAKADDAPDKQACISTAAGCSATQLANQDKYELARHFYDLENQTGYKPTLPQGRATVVRTVVTDADGIDQFTNEYTVTIFWRQKDYAQDADNNLIRQADAENAVQLRTIVR